MTMAIVVYAHTGESVYDFFFLNHLLKKNRVYLLTFNERKPSMVPTAVQIVRIPEPFHPTVSPLTGLNEIINSFLRAFFLKRRLNQFKHDLLISCGGQLYGFYSALSSCSPSILFIWGSDVLVAPKLLPFRFMAKYSLKKASAVVVDSNVQEEACIALGCDPRKIVNFPWVDMQVIKGRSEKTTTDDKGETCELKEKLGWRENDPVVISTRHHEPIYNIECLIHAIPWVIEEAPNARFLILGKGSLTRKLKKSAAMLNISSNVKFLGHVPLTEMPKYLKMVDVYVSTSLSDGTSASLIEAMTCKLPVIVTDIAGNREWITDGSNGLLFPVKDSRLLAERIITLLKDGDRRKSLSANAFTTVCEKANWQTNSKLLDRLITSLVTLK